VICDDLRLTDYLFDLRNPSLSTDLTLKDKADLVECELSEISLNLKHFFSLFGSDIC
jgi:hypothetical protein